MQEQSYLFMFNLSPSIKKFYDKIIVAINYMLTKLNYQYSNAKWCEKNILTIMVKKNSEQLC